MNNDILHSAYLEVLQSIIEGTETYTDETANCELSKRKLGIERALRESLDRRMSQAADQAEQTKVFARILLTGDTDSATYKTAYALVKAMIADREADADTGDTKEG